MTSDRNKQLLNLALELQERDIQPIAISEITIGKDGKKKFDCITKWKNRTKPFTKEEIKRDFSDPKTKNIAVRTGKISNLVVIDIDEDADKEFIEKRLSEYETTVSVETQSSGKHLWLRCSGLVIKNTRSKIATKVDTRAENGIAIIPPSIVEYPDGTVKEYKWINHFNDTLILEPSEELKELLLKADKDSKDSTEDSGSKTPAELLLELITKDPSSYELFHDEQKTPFVRIINSDHYEIWRVESRDFKRYLSAQYYSKINKPINSENIKNALSVLSAKAVFGGKMYRLNNRVAEHDGAFWYDLTNEKWEAVKITEDGYEIIDNPSIIFKRHLHQLPQVTPISGVDLRDYIKFFNLKNPEDEVLFLVWIVACFVPDIPHPLLYPHGVQGSAKSTMMRLLKSLIDHSSAGLLTLVNNKAELAQILSHHWLLAFDNVSYISNELSDTLCKTVSGYAFSKRELYSDDGDIILPIKRPIAINGINMIFTRSDLLERSILIELEPIPNEKRRTEKEVLKQFENEKASFLGAIFSVLSKAMKIKKSIKLDKNERMADFVEWGCPIAEAIGYGSQKFLAAYSSNLSGHNEEIYNSSLPLREIVEFAHRKGECKVTAEDLYHSLTRIIENKGIKPNKYNWVSGPNALGRLINRLKPTLKHYEVYVYKIHENRQRIIYLTTKPIVENVDNNNNGCNNNTQTNESPQDNLKENDPYDKYKRDDF
jgi:hypothetical protein